MFNIEENLVDRSKCVKGGLKGELFHDDTDGFLFLQIVLVIPGNFLTV